jgi:hypothetical protein
VSLVDLPLLRRLNEKSVILDSEIIFTRDSADMVSTFVSSVILPQRGLYTLVTRCGSQQIIGQFRLRADDMHAHVIYMAPGHHDGDDTAYLHMLDAMAREAGRMGAHALLAEVNERSPLFETLRTTGFAVYTRQAVWSRYPATARFETGDVRLKEENEHDLAGVNALIGSTVPSLVHQFALPPADMPRLVYRRGERVEGYLAYAEGRSGIYVIPFLHPDVMSTAPAIVEAAIGMIPRSERVPVFVCVRRYQDWIENALADLQFEPHTHQALMVKHLTAGVRRATFRTVKAAPLTVNHAKPPTTSRVVRWCSDQSSLLEK